MVLIVAVLPAQSRMFGFRFEDDDEAYQFYETVMVRTKARRKFTHRFTSRYPN